MVDIVICHKCGEVFEWEGKTELPEGATLIEAHYYCDRCEGKTMLKVPIETSATSN